MSEKNDTLVQVEHLKKYFPIKGVKGPGCRKQQRSRNR